MLAGGFKVSRFDRVNLLYSSLHVGLHTIPHTGLLQRLPYFCRFGHYFLSELIMLYTWMKSGLKANKVNKHLGKSNLFVKENKGKQEYYYSGSICFLVEL